MSVWPKDNSAPDATCNSGKQSASPDPKSQNLGKGRKRAGVLRRWFSYELLMQRRGPLGSRGVGGEGVAGVLSWNRQGLVTNPADPCTVSPLLLAGRRAPTVTFCLKQKCLSGKLCAHTAHRGPSLTPAPWSRVGERIECWVLAPRSSLTPPAAEPGCLPSAKRLCKTARK